MLYAILDHVATMYSIVVFDGRHCQILRGAFKLIFGFGTSLWEISTSKSFHFCSFNLFYA